MDSRLQYRVLTMRRRRRRPQPAASAPSTIGEQTIRGPVPPAENGARSLANGVTRYADDVTVIVH